jgi:Icc-related predicted phosphoesterase
MRVSVVSDVHGNADALARAGDGVDAVIVLGDLLDFVDYHDHGGGILGTVFGPDKVARFAELRRGRQGAVAAYARTLWASLDNAAEVIEEAIRDQYTKLFGAMTAPTYATPGNVDAPALWPEYAGESVRILDGESIEIGGLRFGFLGGGLLPEGATVRRTGVWVPNLRSESDFSARAVTLGEIDVLCSHIPPPVAELTYDVLARRFELGAATLSQVIRDKQPRWSLFGHVHQPLARRMRIGHTECVNVGHFQRTEVPYLLRW